MKKLLPLLFSMLPLWLPGQQLTGISTYFDDSFTEWRFYTDFEEEEGTLELRWSDNWTEWDYRLNDAAGSIKMKWRDKPDEWELRGDNRIVTARTLWQGDFREWRITDNSTTITLRSRFGNQWDEWETLDADHGEFKMRTAWERDLRDWIIADELAEEVGLEMKMMLAFIVVFHSTPKQ